MAKRRTEVGYVRSVNPARRQLRVTVTPGREDHLSGVKWILLVLSDGSELRCRVEAVEPWSDRPGEVSVALAAGVTRDTVARTRNASVVIDCDGTSEGDYAPSDLLGLNVVDSAGLSLGTVANMYCTGANSVIEIVKSDGGAILAPVIDPVIARVDLEGKLLVLGDYAPYAVEEPKAAKARQ